MTPEVWEDVLWYLAHGVTLRQLCGHPTEYPPPNGETGWPDRVTIQRYRDADPERAVLYEKAERMGAGAIDEECQEISDDADDSSQAAVAKAALRVKVRQWRAAHLDRARFGEWRAVEHSGGTDDRRITVVVHESADPKPIEGVRRRGPQLLDNPNQETSPDGHEQRNSPTDAR